MLRGYQVGRLQQAKEIFLCFPDIITVLALELVETSSLLSLTIRSTSVT